MRPLHYTMTPKDVYRYAAEVLLPHLQWQDPGPKGTVHVLLHIAFYAAARMSSLFAACQRLCDTLITWRMALSNGQAQVLVTKPLILHALGMMGEVALLPLERKILFLPSSV